MVAAFAPDRAPPAAHVTVADLAQHRLVAPRRGSAITSVLAQRFADAGKPLRLALESGDPFLLSALAARGFATAILPLSLIGPGRTRRRGAQPGPGRSSAVAFVWRRERNLSPAARACIEFVRRETAKGDRITQDPGIAR